MVIPPTEQIDGIPRTREIVDANEAATLGKLSEAEFRSVRSGRHPNGLGEAAIGSPHVSVSISGVWGWLWRAPAVTLFTFRGITVQAHWSLVIPLVVDAGFLGSNRYLGRYPELSATTITAMTIVSVLLVPLATLLHEFGHSFQARREGWHADRITLWGLGGASWSSGSSSPGAEFRVVAAGPMVSLILAVLFGALGWLAKRAGMATGVVGVLVLFAQFNAAVAAFNLLPAVPMDGGRLLQSALWRLRGGASAAKWAVRVGVVIGLTVLAFGAVAPFLGILVPQAGFHPGFAIMFSGVIMLGMTLDYAGAVRGQPPRSGELRVGDLMEVSAPGDAPAPGMTVARFLENAVVAPPGYGTAASAVLEDGRTVGVISRGLAGRVPLGQRETTAIADVMLRKEDAVVLKRETTIAEAFRLLQEASRQGVVLDRGRVRAIILMSDLAHVILAVRDAARGVVGQGT